MNTILKISFLGDIFPGEMAYTINYGIKSQFNSHKGLPWIYKLNNYTKESDLVIANLESPLVDSRSILKETFCGYPDFANFLKKGGIDVVNIANNHILEHDSAGYYQTIEYLKRANVGIIGLQEDGKSKVSYLHIKNVKIGIAGFSNVDLEVIDDEKHFAILRENEVLNVIEEMKSSNADLKILSFHWGNEYIHVPSLNQRELAYKFIKAGADIIVGHHPHVIQPYEKYMDGHIFYSLGNFMFDIVHSRMVSIGLMAQVLVDTNKNQIITELEGVKLSYRDTFSKMSKHKFDKYYSKISKQYKNFINLPDVVYKKKYRKLLKRNRLNQRILMKTSIVIEFFRIGRKDKIKLMYNVINYYFNTLLRRRTY